MPPLNTTQVLPSKLYWYTLTKILLILFAFSIFLTFAGNWFVIYLTMVVLIGLPIWGYLALTYKFTSYTISESMVTVNSGIIFKRSLTIPFNNIQNSDSSRGPLSTLFGLSHLKIWTASPSQIRIQKGNSKNIPESQLWLETAIANSIKDFILSKK